MKTIWYSNFSAQKFSFAGAQPHSGFHLLCLPASLPQGQSWAVRTKAVWLIKLKIFTSCPLREKFIHPICRHISGKQTLSRSQLCGQTGTQGERNHGVTRIRSAGKHLRLKALTATWPYLGPGRRAQDTWLRSICGQRRYSWRSMRMLNKPLIDLANL